MVTFSERFSANQKELITLMCGKDKGKAAWYYIRFKNKIKYIILINRIKNDRSKIDLTEYGDILESGWGELPPPEVQDKFDNGYRKSL